MGNSTATSVLATADYQRLDAAHYLHPFSDSGAQAKSRVISRADGVHLWDTDGNKFLDGMSGLWCVNMGYGRDEIVDAAAAQMRELPYYNSFFQCATPPAIELAAALAEVSPPGFNNVFYTGSGSEANDTVVRMIRRYWALREQPQRTVIISRLNAYHGSTMAGASLGGMAFMHEQGGLPIPDITHIAQPYWYGEGQHMTADEFGLQAAKALADKIEEIGAARVAAFIGEPIQGAGGVIIPPDTYWPEIQRICDHYDVPLVADEVICGFGRMGEWFGSTHFGIRPKLMPIAKGLSSGYLPIGGVLVHDDIAEVLAEKCGEFAHGFTYSGHPACAAAALANLRLMHRENIVEKVKTDTAPYFKKQWATLSAHPLVGEARSVGLMAALELAEEGKPFPPAKGVGALCRDMCLSSGLVMRATRDTMIAAPSLVITHAQIDEMIAKVFQALDKTMAACKQ